MHSPLILDTSAHHKQAQGDIKVGLSFLWIGILCSLSFQSLEQDQYLAKLPYASSAAFDAYPRRHEPICLPNTRVELLNQIKNWNDDPNGECIFWLNGMAGIGKSTIAR